jgi:hypothetical protein
MDSTTVAAVIGMVIAAGFWIFTQWNVINVGKKIKAFQQEARLHADTLIVDNFKEMERLLDSKISNVTSQIPKLDYSQIEKQIPKPNYAEIRLLVREEISKIDLPEIPPMPDMEALRSSILSDINQQLNAMMPAIMETVQTSLKNEYKALVAGENRKLAGELKKYGVEIEELGGTMRNEIISQATEGMSPTEMAALKFLAYKPRTEWLEENPGAATFLEFSKMMAVQYVQQAQGNGGNIVQSGKQSNSRKALPSGNQDKSGVFG